MTFGKVVSLYLKERGMSQSELARRANIGKQTLSDLIVGENSNPRLDTALSIAEALGVSLQEIVDRMGEC